MIKPKGFTTIELLIAIAIFATVLTLASQGIVTTLRAKSSQDTIVAAQEKARRIGQAISYDVRSSIFGSLIDSPYPVTTQNVSFMLLDGAAGFNVTGKTGSGYTISTQTTSISGLSVGGQVLVVNQNGDGYLYPISSISSTGTSHTINFSGCTKTPIDVIGDSLMFQVSTVGYRYNATNKTLYRKVNSNVEEIVAFDIQADTGFPYDVDYIYEAPDGTLKNPINPPRLANNAIAISYTESGKVYTLARLQFGIRVEGKGLSGQKLEKDITTTIEVKDAVTNNNFRGVTRGVLSCN